MRPVRRRREDGAEQGKREQQGEAQLKQLFVNRGILDRSASDRPFPASGSRACSAAFGEGISSQTKSS